LNERRVDVSKRNNKKRSGSHGERRVSVRAVRRDPPDLKKLSQALIALAVAQAEAEAQAEHKRSDVDDKRRPA
jgi:hypothetical protein